jgi:hypothetical protein
MRDIEYLDTLDRIADRIDDTVDPDPNPVIFAISEFLGSGRPRMAF